MRDVGYANAACMLPQHALDTALIRPYYSLNAVFIEP